MEPFAKEQPAKEGKPWIWMQSAGEDSTVFRIRNSRGDVEKDCVSDAEKANMRQRTVEEKQKTSRFEK
jgi:hypothetical protein